MITTQDFEIAAAEFASVPPQDRPTVYAYTVRFFKRVNPRFDEVRFQTAIARYLGQREAGLLDTPATKR